MRQFFERNNLATKMLLTDRNPKYTLLDSGYLERLIDRFGLVRYNLDLIKGQITLASEDPNYHKDEEDDEFDFIADDPRPIFLYSSYICKNIYCSPDLNLEKYQADILKVFAIERPKGSLCGLIMFENEGENTYDKVKFLKRQDYCACFGVMGMNTYFDGNEFFAVEYKIDGESG